MKTNDLKKGDRIQLRNGWYGTIADNRKGNIRLADVEGICREIGSVYAHDINAYMPSADSSTWRAIEHTPAQLKLKATVEAF